MRKRIKDFLLNNRGIRQTVAKNTFWMAAGQIGSRLFRAALIIYAARVLGAAGYGVFSYVVGLAGFFTVLADLGVNTTLTREVSQKPNQTPSYFSTALGIKLGLLVLTAAVIVFVTPFLSDIEEVKMLVPLAALLTIFDALREFSSAYFRGKEKMELEALLMVVTNVSITVIGFVILFFSATAKSLTIAYILSAGTGAILGIYILRKKFFQAAKYFKKKLVLPIMKSALPISLLGILGVFMLNIDIVMIGFYEGAEEVGFYSASQKIVQLLYVLPVIIAASTFPAISRLISEKKTEKVKTLMERSVTMVLLIALPIAIGGAVLSNQLIKLVYGSGYAPSSPVFFFLILTPILVFPGMLIGNYIFAYNRQGKIVSRVLAGIISNVALNAILIPLLGITGCAIATIGAQLVYNGSILKLARKIKHFEITPYIKNIVLATIIMGGFTFVFKVLGFNVILNIILAIGIYFGILYFLKEETLREVRKIISGVIS
jgi:O-antigen/teichoic acid export membrane protein